MSADDRVLLITENEALYTQLSVLLKGNVSRASDKTEAVTLLHSADYRAVLLDMGKRGSSAYELCRLIKRESGLGRVSVIFLYSKGSGFDVQKARDCQASDWLEIPFRDEGLARFQILQRASMWREEANSKAMTAESVSIIDLMSHRAAAILECMLFAEFKISPIGDRSKFEKRVLNSWRKQLSSVTARKGFQRLLCERCLTRLPALAWMEATERIIDEHKCEINGFGNFQVSREYGELIAQFMPAEELREYRVPRMLYRGVRSSFQAATSISHDQLGPELYKLLNAPLSAPLLSFEKSIDLLASSIPGALAEINDVEQLESTDLQQAGWNDLRVEWLTIQGTMLAHLTFYTYCAYFTRILRMDKVTLGNLGTLQLRDATFILELSDYMKRLLNAFWPKARPAMQ
jgi:CheY-like chemotaxis protein